MIRIQTMTTADIEATTQNSTLNVTAPGQYRVIKRNGTLVPFNGDKVSIAIKKAFLAIEGQAEMAIGNSHVATLAKRLGLPVLRADFPQYDLIGGYRRTWVGYRGASQALFDIANELNNLERGEIAPYRSIYAHLEVDA